LLRRTRLLNEVAIGTGGVEIFGGNSFIPGKQRGVKE